MTDLKHVALFAHDLSMLTDRIKDRCGLSQPHWRDPRSVLAHLGESRDADCRGINYEQVARWGGAWRRVCRFERESDPNSDLLIALNNDQQPSYGSFKATEIHPLSS